MAADLQWQVERAQGAAIRSAADLKLPVVDAMLVDRQAYFVSRVITDGEMGSVAA